jgi:cell fate regulator YaaT (PSP1 superfamily)
LCCATFLKDFEPVSLRMARDQDLPANPLRISGACGRLMCCLKYEHPLYAEFARTAPAVGSRVSTDQGDGVVVAHQVPADSVVVRMRDSGAVTSCSRASVCGSRAAYRGRGEQEPTAD